MMPSSAMLTTPLRSENPFPLELLDVLADEFGLGHAGELFVGGVGLKRIAVAVGDEHAVLDAVEDGVEVSGHGVEEFLHFFSQGGPLLAKGLSHFSQAWRICPVQ